MYPIAKLVCILLLAFGISACAASAPAPQSVGLAHHVIVASDLAGKTLYVPRTADNPRYEVMFNADGSFTRTTYGPRTRTFTGHWRILENGDVSIKTQKLNAAMTFHGPAADGSFIMIGSTGSRTPKYVTLR